MQEKTHFLAKYLVVTKKCSTFAAFKLKYHQGRYRTSAAKADFFVSET